MTAKGSASASSAALVFFFRESKIFFILNCIEQNFFFIPPFVDPLPRIRTFFGSGMIAHLTSGMSSGIAVLLVLSYHNIFLVFPTVRIGFIVLIVHIVLILDSLCLSYVSSIVSIILAV